MAATAGLTFFGQMRAELRGDWRQAHAELCAQMQPVLCESDQLLFEGVHGLRRPLVLLAGGAALLALPHPTRKETVEVADVMPGDCLAPAVLTWMQPRIATAVCRGTAQLIALPAAVYGERLKLPHLRLLQARLALGRACTGQDMHWAGHALGIHRRFTSGCGSHPPAQKASHAMPVPCPCCGHAMPMLWPCHAHAMPVPRPCCGHAMPMLWPWHRVRRRRVRGPCCSCRSSRAASRRTSTRSRTRHAGRPARPGAPRPAPPAPAAPARAPHACARRGGAASAVTAAWLALCRATILGEGEACEGLAVLVAGRARVCVKLAPEGSETEGEGGEGGEGGEEAGDQRGEQRGKQRGEQGGEQVVLAHLCGVETMGLIDWLHGLVECGRSASPTHSLPHTACQPPISLPPRCTSLPPPISLPPRISLHTYYTLPTHNVAQRRGPSTTLP